MCNGCRRNRVPNRSSTFTLCCSLDRVTKGRAIRERFEAPEEKGLLRIQTACEKRFYQVGVIERRIERLLAKTSRGTGLSEVTVKTAKQARPGPTHLVQEKTKRTFCGTARDLMCYAATSPTGRPRNSGGLTFRRRRRRPRYESRRTRCYCGRSGIKKPNGSRRTSWSASWLTCCVRRSKDGANESALGAAYRHCWEYSIGSTAWTPPDPRGRKQKTLRPPASPAHTPFSIASDSSCPTASADSANSTQCSANFSESHTTNKD